MKRAALILGFWVQIGLPSHAQERAEVDFGYVAERAKDLAAEAYVSRRGDLPEELRSLDYDGYRRIRFRPEMSLWREEKLNFFAQFFHPGYIYQTPVQMNEFTDSHVQRIRFVEDFFIYDGPSAELDVPASTGYAGFRLHYPLHADERPGVYDEAAVFLGASYFRMLGKNQSFGLSARGLAVNSGIPGVMEEFPEFVEFWLKKPAGSERHAQVYALLDSPSLTGAYGFRIEPGDETIADVEAAVFFRSQVKSLGLAPLTSMFWFGENSERLFNDYREEVHDSDGLVVKPNDGPPIWRPLVNGTSFRNATIEAEGGAEAFGLLQRDRDFANYQDLENPQHRAPSLVIEPAGDWPAGHVRLFEIETTNEAMDNVVAFWEIEAPSIEAPLRFSYRMRWMMDEDRALSENRVVATRIGEVVGAPHLRQFAIDFEGPAFEQTADAADEAVAQPQPEAPEFIAETSSDPPGRIAEAICVRNPHTGGWRALIKASVGPDGEPASPVTLTCFLKSSAADASPATERWSFFWTP